MTRFLLSLLIAQAAPAQAPALDPGCAAGDAAICTQVAARLLKEAKTAADSARSTAHQLKACELKQGGACNDYGVALVNGTGLAADPAASARYYLRGCDLGSMVACRNYGYNMLKGQYGLTRDVVKAVPYLTRACEGNYLTACVDLATAERDGLIAGKGPRDGLALLVNACDRYSALGCVRAGFQLRDSVGVPADLPGAMSFFKRACDQGGSTEADPFNAGEGCGSLAWAYERGLGVPLNPGRAATLYKRGCDFGSAYSCTGLGIMTLGGTLPPRDSARAAALFLQACRLRQAAGCGNYGHMLPFGWPGQRPDSAAARRMLEQSCEQDFVVGCRWLAENVRAGLAGPPDTAAAILLYQRACDKRDAASCAQLGYAYDGGRGVPRDERKAVALNELACGLGDTTACNNLGVALRNGTAVTQDLARANRIFQQECEHDNFRACANLGYSYEFGRGMPLDESRAMEFYKKSCLQGDSYGCAQLQRMAPDSAALLSRTPKTDSARGAPAGAAGNQVRQEDAPVLTRGLWALVVGLSRYASPAIRPLTYARKDAESFAGFLMSANGGGFLPDHVQLLVDEKATADALRRGLHSFLRRANQGDLVIIYFAGHGRQPGNEGGIPYFLTYDTDPREMAATAVPMDELRRAVQQSISARYIVAFIDACHSGGVTLSTRGSEDNDLINRYLKELSRSKETVVTFAASQENQESLEGPEYGGGHGAFTWHVMQGLGGAADRISEGGDESGTVTLRELAEYVTRKVKDATHNLQEPSLSYLKWDPSLVLSVIRPH